MSKCFSIPLVSLQSVLFILQHLQAFPASVYTHSSFSLLLWCPHSCLMNLLLVLYPGHWETKESISPSASTTSSLQWGTEAEGWWRPFLEDTMIFGQLIDPRPAGPPLHCIATQTGTRPSSWSPLYSGKTCTVAWWFSMASQVPFYGFHIPRNLLCNIQA